MVSNLLYTLSLFQHLSDKYIEEQAYLMANNLHTIIDAYYDFFGYPSSSDVPGTRELAEEFINLYQQALEILEIKIAEHVTTYETRHPTSNSYATYVCSENFPVAVSLDFTPWSSNSESQVDVRFLIELWKVTC